jgi:hypothetical protein
LCLLEYGLAEGVFA